jgi:hypothetical protein
LSQLSDEQIKQMVHRYIQQSIESWDRSFYDPPAGEAYPPPFTDAREFKEHLDFLETIRDDLIADLNLGNYSMLEQSICDVFRKNGINDIDEDSQDYRKFCAEIFKAEIQLTPMKKGYMLCDVSYRNELSDLYNQKRPETKSPFTSRYFYRGGPCKAVL